VTTTDRPRNSAQPAARNVPEVPVRTLTSAEIFEGTTEVQILHEQAVYRLKITRQGKLILNK